MPVIQIIVITHGRLAIEFINTTELIVGRQAADLHPVCLEMHEGIEDLTRKLTAIIKPPEKPGDGCLALVDMFGGTPSNVALALTRDFPQLQVVTGVSLPMLIEAVTHRALMTLPQLTDFVKEKGKKAVLHANEFLHWSSEG